MFYMRTGHSNLSKHRSSYIWKKPVEFCNDSANSFITKKKFLKAVYTHPHPNKDIDID